MPEQLPDVVTAGLTLAMGAAIACASWDRMSDFRHAQSRRAGNALSLAAGAGMLAPYAALSIAFLTM